MIEGRDGKSLGKVLQYGMVGGGEGSFIGDVHRKAIGFDRKAVLAAGCFSRNYENTIATGKNLGISTERLYTSFKEMAEKEAARNDKIDFVSIVTPNYAHYEVAKIFLENGINVVCDKPLCFEIKQAEELEGLAKAKDLLFCVMYSYSGYPMVKQAREMIRMGDIGEIRVVMGEYPQDWLATSVEKASNRQASWRTDPKLSGISNCIGDIGSHIENTVAYITGLKIKYLCANLDIFGEDRVLDDNAEVLVRYVNGATGVYWSSQVAIGHENGLKVRIFGTKGSIEWEQENPNYLKVALLAEPVRIFSRGSGYLYPQASKLGRIPAGHPEGYYEAFANIYSAFIDALLKKIAGTPLDMEEFDFPNAGDGISGVKFINKCVESSKKGAVWISLE